MVGKNSEVREVVTEARFAEPSNDSLIIQYNVRGQWGVVFIATHVSGEFCDRILIICMKTFSFPHCIEVIDKI